MTGEAGPSVLQQLSLAVDSSTKPHLIACEIFSPEASRKSGLLGWTVQDIMHRLQKVILVLLPLNWPGKLSAEGIA